MNSELNKEKLLPNNDIVFKRLFGRVKNKAKIKEFLEAILEIEIKDVILEKETELLPESLDEKVGILDVRAELDDGTLIDIEMQNVNQGNIEKRVTYYLNQLYTGELQKGKTYNELNKAIAIGILNFDYFTDIKEHHTKWKMSEQNNKDKTLEEQEIHFIELPKFLRSEINMDRKLDQWLAFIDFSRKELVKMAEEKNNMVKEAVAEYEYLVGDEAVQRLAFLKRKWELDYNTGIENAEKRGKEHGIEIGEKRGKELGKRENQIEIAKKSKAKGLPIEMIAELTGLSKEEIEKL